MSLLCPPANRPPEAWFGNTLLRTSLPMTPSRTRRPRQSFPLKPPLRIPLAALSFMQLWMVIPVSTRLDYSRMCSYPLSSSSYTHLPMMALVDPLRRDLYVACTGDSRAVAGIWEENEDGTGKWRVEVLTEDQTGRNENEAKRCVQYCARNSLLFSSTFI